MHLDLGVWIWNIRRPICQEQMLNWQPGLMGGNLIGGPIWAFAWSNIASPADFSCTSNLSASSPAQRYLVAFSPQTRVTQNVGIAAFHAENAKSVENSCFLKEASVTNQGWSEPDSVSAQKRAPEGQKGRRALLPRQGVECGGWPRGCEARLSWVCIQILPLSSLLTFLRQVTSLRFCFSHL